MKKGIIAIVIILLILAGVYVWQNSDQNLAVENTERNVDMLSGNATTTIAAEMVEYFDGTNGYYARPEADGNYPGVVMVHEWWGLNDQIKDMAEELARSGFRVLAVDLYRGRVATTSADAQKYRSEATTTETTANLQAAAGYLREEGATKVASLGWCYGGGKSLELALSGEPLDATVIYYGTLVTDPEKLEALDWPVLGIFGDQDTSIPVAKVREFETALETKGIENEIYIYPGVGHAFANPSGMNYAPAETKDAWAKTLQFLNSHLKTS